jgi:hypothetical protein
MLSIDKNIPTVRAERGLPLLSGNGPRGRRVPTAATSPLRKADVPVFFDHILITSRRNTLKQDNTMATGSHPANLEVDRQGVRDVQTPTKISVGAPCLRVYG